MDKTSNHQDHAGALGNNESSSITFDTVVNLNQYAGKNVTLNIYDQVVEHPGHGHAASVVSVQESVRLTANGKPVSEQALNNLTLTEHGRTVNLTDHTYINANARTGHNRAKVRGTSRNAKQDGIKANSAGEHIVPKLEIGQ